MMSWVAANPDSLLWMTATVALLESLALVGVLIPGVVLLLLLSALAASQEYSIYFMTASLWVGLVLGDTVSYLIGRRVRDSVMNLPVLRRRTELLEQAQQIYEDYGLVALALGRFIGPLRPVLPLTAGVFRMGVGEFMLINVTTASIWSLSLMVPAYGLAESLIEGNTFLSMVFATVLLLMLLTAIIVGRWLFDTESKDQQ